MRTEVQTGYAGEVETGKLGIWLFLVSEVMLFGGLISSYFMARWGSTVCALGAPAWPKAGQTGGLALATFNTVILLTSSFTMARAVAFAREGESRQAAAHLGWTLGLGVLFLLVKALEYSVKIGHGYYPQSRFMADVPGLNVFVSYYFALTGFHALHVMAGVAWQGVIWRRVRGGGEDAAIKLEYAGLYWHFVDVVWVFLFPLFYLI